MINATAAIRRFLVGTALGLLASAPAFANPYAISLFQGATGTGAGSFTFANGGVSGAAVSPTVSTNASSTPNIGVITFTSGGTGLTAVVVPVNFSDSKTPPNQIAGNYVEGLAGSLTANGPFDFSGCEVSGNNCVATLTFAYAGCCAVNQNPNTATKTYSIVVIDGIGALKATVAGTYGVIDTVNGVPEPGSLALVAIGFAALVWLAFARRRQKAAAEA